MGLWLPQSFDTSKNIIVTNWPTQDLDGWSVAPWSTKLDLFLLCELDVQTPFFLLVLSIDLVVRNEFIIVWACGLNPKKGILKWVSICCVSLRQTFLHLSLGVLQRTLRKHIFKSGILLFCWCLRFFHASFKDIFTWKI